MNFVYELYKNENFTTYLIIALVVLLALFVIVLIFGKKDQKLEETKKLQKIDLDAFKEKKEEPKKVEVSEIKKEETSQLKIETEELPKLKEEVHVIEFEPESKGSGALLSEDVPTLKFDEEGLEKDLQELESIKKEFSDIELPKVDEKKETVTSKPSPQIYSSVYVPKSDEPKIKIKIDDDEEIELPSLK